MIAKYLPLVLLATLAPAVRAEPGVVYAPWVPGDAGLFIDQNDEAWEACMGRGDACPQEYIYQGPVRRISENVVLTPGGTYMCNVAQVAALDYPAASCTENGWLLQQCRQQELPSGEIIPCVTGRYGEGGY